MATVSVDLASRKYVDIGIAVLIDIVSAINVELIWPSELGLTGVPDAQILAGKLIKLAEDKCSNLLFLDGPQGWCARTTLPKIMRDCERATHTPGKTGLPGCVKPRPFRRMVEFSIAVFDALHDAGWQRLGGNWCGERCSIESFPTHAWRNLGFDPLPAKKPLRRIERWADILSEHWAVRWPRLPNHDELQAVVAGLAGVLIERHGLEACVVDGSAPFIDDGSWREGFIVSPDDLCR